MSATPSPEFQRFVTSLDAPAMSAAQAYAFDERALAALDPGERAQAEALLVTRLDNGDENPRLVEAAATLQTPAALDGLRRRLATPSMTAITAAYRLWVISQDPAAVSALASFCRSAPAPSWRQAAAALLKDIPGSEANQALMDALGDGDRSVRSTAYENLVLRFHLGDYKRAGGPLFHHAFGLLSSFPSVRAAAQGGLATIFAGLQQGTTPEAMGLVAGTPQLSPTLVRFRDTLGIFRPAPKDGSTFDLDALDQLADDEREYATDLLIGRLDQGFLRAAEGLAKLATPLARAALVDAAHTLEPGPMLDAVNAARASLP